MSQTDRFAILIALAAILAAYLTAAQVFELIPHIEDEMAFVWQAQVYARGELTVASPAHPKNLMTPFVVDYQGQRFAKYPPGWPVVLAFGYLLGGRAWVNPLLAGLAVLRDFRALPCSAPRDASGWQAGQKRKVGRTVASLAWPPCCFF